jgi:D-methionine transport system permease protein
VNGFEDLVEQLPRLWRETGATLYIVAGAMLFGGVAGLAIGTGLWATRAGGLFPHRALHWVLNLLVNTFRPIPFIIFLPAIQPLPRAVIGTGIGDRAIIFSVAIAASFAIGRIVEQNLLTVRPGVVEAARAMGSSRRRIVFAVAFPEALGPLVLGYTFAFVALVDMSAVAGSIGGGGLGAFAIQYGFRQFNPWITWAAVLVMILIVHVAQFLGNRLTRQLMRR